MNGVFSLFYHGDRVKKVNILINYYNNFMAEERKKKLEDLRRRREERNRTEPLSHGPSHNDILQTHEPSRNLIKTIVEQDLNGVQ
jgi:hypothetical protein